MDLEVAWQKNEKGDTLVEKMKVLVLNAGSSSLKYRLYQMPEGEALAQGVIERIGEKDSSFSYYQHDKVKNLAIRINKHEKGIALILKWLTDEQVGVIKKITEIGAVGHRVVHGGEEFTKAVLIKDEILASLQRLTNLAPLHNSPSINSIQIARKILCGVPHIACFDTAFHSTIPPVAFTYGLPYDICQKYGIRRYGFHGLSHQYVAGRAAKLLGKKKNDINAITCHLGNGCSITAIRNGQPIDTSMGFTPLEGLVMGTRSGDFDPAILFYLIEKGYDHKSLNLLCNKKSGLLGISGMSKDMRILQQAANEGNIRAKLAIDIFTYHIKKYIGAYVAIIENLEALVFTGGIGENSAKIRSLVCQGLSHIGIGLDKAQNKNTVNKEGCISNTDRHVKVLAIPTNEEATIANETFKLAIGKRRSSRDRNQE